MSKAFTREDDDAGFTPPPSAAPSIPAGPIRLTTTGAQVLAGREGASDALREALARAEVIPPTDSEPPRAALGVTVVVKDARALTRRYRLVTPEEHTLLGEGCSVASPMGRALLGAEVGEVREVTTPRGAEELEVVALEGEAKRNV